jgi:hypothetical protein
MALLLNRTDNVRRNKIEVRSRNHCCRRKAISITYSECVSLASVTQHAMRMPRINLSSVAYLALQYFSTLPRKRHDFRKKVIEHKMCFDYLYNFCLKHHSKKNSARYCKCT